MSRFQLSNWLVLILLLGVVSLPAAHGQATKTEPAKSAQESDGPVFPDLGEGLRKTPGCLGVESGATDSGKEVIFAWFKDKESVMKWYKSGMHQGVMNEFFPERSDREPLAGIPDDSGPILAIASITFSDEPKFEDTQLPISQISIELYKPLAGGLSLGGTFAPKSLHLDGHLDYAEAQRK